MIKRQLCWECANARADRCSWMCDFTAVPNWDAEVVPRQTDKKGHTIKEETFWIKSCPNFVPDYIKIKG